MNLTAFNLGNTRLQTVITQGFYVQISINIYFIKKHCSRYFPYFYSLTPRKV